jgi:hypothetical protein
MSPFQRAGIGAFNRARFPLHALRQSDRPPNALALSPIHEAGSRQWKRRCGPSPSPRCRVPTRVAPREEVGAIRRAGRELVCRAAPPREFAAIADIR